ncbi:MAG: Exodeoxyribonuclease I [Rhodanobacteraceae bacterium]|jgi:exodeoxyribonuclease-1|nr:MAG: Exodeoxyribonuclease I [Rhodanobacteraceae bacterium]
MPTPTLLWYDYETTGTDPVRDRPAQFAAIRTGMDLQPVADPVTLYCAPSPDTLPHPEACLITGIAPQDAAREGLPEAEFAGAVHELMAEPGTCSAGYNSIRFDDEVNRNLFYRNFLDPYEHTWRNGNARWDVMDLARACYALRPAGIEWPRREDGIASFKLEDLAAANKLEQQRAHDALSDVRATIALARLLRDRQPRLYDWHFALRDKKKVSAMLASAQPGMQPLLHVSGRFPPARGCLAMVAPVAEQPDRAGTFIVADLGVDPDAWANLEPDELVERMFTRREDLPDDLERPPLKAVHANKSPFLAPVETLRGVDTARISLDPERCLRHLDVLRASTGLRERVQQAFVSRGDAWPARADPELLLYAGFPSDADRRRCDKVRSTPPAKLAATGFKFDNPRYAELLFRYRARNWPDTLTADEHARWRAFVRDKLTRETETTTLTLEQYFATLARLRGEVPPGPQQALLDRLQDWGETLRNEFGT